MNKVIVKIKIEEGSDGSNVSVFSISALDSGGNKIPVFGGISKIRAFGNRLIVPHEYLTEEQEIIIEPDNHSAE
jgi:hypothetical protein